jgi:hypothetical protein
MSTTVRKNAVHERNQKKAYYIAEAGIEKALARYPALKGFKIENMEYAGGLIEKVKVEENENGSFYLITSKGCYPKDGPLKATKTLEIKINTLPYKGQAESQALGVSAFDQLIGLTAGESLAQVDTSDETTPYAKGEATPIKAEVADYQQHLQVESKGGEGEKSGVLIAANLGNNLELGLAKANANSSITPPAARGSGELASIKLTAGGVTILEVGALDSSSEIKPDFKTGELTSISKSKLTEITVLGDLPLVGDVLKIDTFETNAQATANGKPGGASCDYNAVATGVKILGKEKNLEIGTNLTIGWGPIDLLKLNIGTPTTLVKQDDGKKAEVSLPGLKIEILDLNLPGFNFNGATIEISGTHALAEVPEGGLKPYTIFSWNEKLKS